MIVDLTTIKSYLRVDDDTEDDLLQLMYDKAVTDINDSVDYTVEEANELLMASNALNKIKLLILLMVNDMYNNRELVTEKSINKYTQAVQSTLLQLKYCYSELVPIEEVIVE